MQLIVAAFAGAIACRLGSAAANIQIPLQALDARAELAHSPPHYPSPWMDPKATGWEEAYAKAKAFVSQLTLLEKVNITTGPG